MEYSPYFDPLLETLSREEITALQLQRLRSTVEHCMHSSFYAKRLKQCGVSADSIKSLDDLKRIPFTTKQDLRNTYPFGIASVKPEECVRLHSSSGTTGNPTVILHTQKDLNEWAAAVARCLWMVGLRPYDVFQNSSGYGMFTGGLGFQYGAEKMGMLTVPAAAGNTKRQIKFMTDFGTTAVHAIPSYATRLYEVMEEQGIDPRTDTRLHTLIIGAEPHSEEQRRRIEEMLGVKAYNSFGMSEMCGPGVAFECREQNGLHIWEDYYIVEIVDPETLRPVPDGEVGELVLTTLNREAMPLLRYRTRDLTRLQTEQCKCGRTMRVMDRVHARSDDMLIIHGVNVFPSQIEACLMKVPEIAPHYMIELSSTDTMDLFELKVEVTAETFSDSVSAMEAIRKRVAASIKEIVGLSPKIYLVAPGTLPRSQGKIKRVIDNRRK